MKAQELIETARAMGLCLGHAFDVNGARNVQRLPQPHVISPRVDFERTKTWNVKAVTWIPFRGDEDAMRDQAMYHAHKLVELAASSEENLNAARTRAVQVIEATYRMV